MSSVENRDAEMNLLRAEFQREQAIDFSLLRQIPCTHVRKFLDYFSTLDITGKNALAEGLAESAHVYVFRRAEDIRRPYKDKNAAWRKYVDALPLMWDWKYESIRELRMRLAVAKLEPHSSIAISITDEVRKRIESIKPVKSAEIRKVVKLALSQIITPIKVTHEGQFWLYEGELNGKPISVTMDYSHRYHQLDYWVSTPNQQRSLWGLNYERLMGLSLAQWDLLEQSNLDQSIALLKELISHCADTLYRLPTEPTK